MKVDILTPKEIHGDGICSFAVSRSNFLTKLY